MEQSSSGSATQQYQDVKTAIINRGHNAGLVVQVRAQPSFFDIRRPRVLYFIHTADGRLLTSPRGVAASTAIRVVRKYERETK